MFVFLAPDIYNARKACHEIRDSSIISLELNLSLRRTYDSRIPCGRATVGPRLSTLKQIHRHHQPPRLADHHRVHERSDRRVADLAASAQKRHPRRGPSRDGGGGLGPSAARPLDRPRPLVVGLGSPFRLVRQVTGDRPGSKPVHPRQQIRRNHRNPVLFARFWECVRRPRASRAAKQFCHCDPAPGWKTAEHQFGVSLPSHRTSVDGTRSLYFGLSPAALMGIDVTRLLTRATIMAQDRISPSDRTPVPTLAQRWPH